MSQHNSLSDINWNRLAQCIEDVTASADHNMQRDRPYTGQAHTSMGERGKTEVSGISFRDLRDAFVRAVALAAADQNPALYAQAAMGEHGTVCANDLYELDLNKLDIMAVEQNLSVEVEKMMGIYPNLPDSRDHD